MKTWRMSYWDTDSSSSSAEAFVNLLDEPGEVRIGVGGKSFISVKEDGISISGGTPSSLNVQSLGFKFAGMVSDLPFPMSMIPSTTYTPFPKQTIVPPFLEQLPTIQQVAVIATSMAGF
jgi:hypothetical protein